MSDIAINILNKSETYLMETALDVNDTTLELSYKIKNNTDHDVWICDSVSTHSKSERYLAEDAQTLVIRKRLDISPELAWAAAPLGQYVRLQPAQEYSESLSCALPIRPALTYIGERSNAESAKRLVLEIGFYDQDLPGLVRSIIEVVERLSCANVEFEDYESNIMRHYFKGLLIKGRFGSLSIFDERHKDVSEQFITTYTDQLLGEQILQISVDGLYIPYEGYIQSASLEANEPYDSPDVEEEKSAVSMELTHFEVTDANLELSWKIINNTDHDVWICDSLDFKYGVDFEVYMAEDEQTLMVRRRLDVPTEVLFGAVPIGRYIRISPGQERTESLSLALPVHPRLMFATEQVIADNAKRVAVEIGFYNEDLPMTIRNILELAEKLNCAVLDTAGDYRTALFQRFFKGLWIEKHFGGLQGFETHTYKDGDEQIPISYSQQRFISEQILRAEVDNISIPYKDDDLPLTSKEIK